MPPRSQATQPGGIASRMGPNAERRPGSHRVHNCAVGELSSSGEKLMMHDHRVACSARSPHETSFLHPPFHPPGVQGLHPRCQHSQDSAPHETGACAHRMSTAGSSLARRPPWSWPRLRDFTDCGLCSDPASGFRLPDEPTAPARPRYQDRDPDSADGSARDARPCCARA